MGQHTVKLTPGPWRWGDWGVCFGERERTSRRKTLEHSPHYLDESNDVIRLESDNVQSVVKIDSIEEISKDDAELIRRAPELREALLEVLRDFGGNMDSTRFKELRALAMEPVDD